MRTVGTGGKAALKEPAVLRRARVLGDSGWALHGIGAKCALGGANHVATAKLEGDFLTDFCFGGETFAASAAVCAGDANCAAVFVVR